MLVPDLLRDASEKEPGRVAAILDSGGQMTYAEWDARSNAAARGLGARGVAPGGRVALMFDNTRWLDYAVAYFAVSKAGAVVVPVSPRLSAAEVSRLLEHCGAKTAIAPPEHRNRLPDSELVVVDDINALITGNDSSMFQVPRGESDLAEILYTSGTTGLPRGVATPHGNVATETISGTLLPGVTFLHAIPATTFAGTYAMMVVPVANRWTNVVMPKFDAERYCQLVEQHRPQLSYIVPAMARLIVDSGASSRHDVSSLQFIWFGTAPMPSSTLQRLHQAFPAAILVNIYGATEGGAAGTATAYDPAHPGSAGKPIGQSRLRVLNEEGRQCPVDEVGEVWIGTPAGRPPRFYYGDEEASAATFDGDWVRTGDLGYIDADGFLYVVDRVKDIINRGGLKVSTVEVEEALLRHPAVQEVAVFGVTHEVLGEDVAAAVVTHAGRAATPAQLEAHCRAQLADYKVPRHIELVDELPRNALGKVLKRELRAGFEARRVAAGGSATTAAVSE